MENEFTINKIKSIIDKNYNDGIYDYNLVISEIVDYKDITKTEDYPIDGVVVSESKQLLSLVKSEKINVKFSIRQLAIACSPYLEFELITVDRKDDIKYYKILYIIIDNDHQEIRLVIKEDYIDEFYEKDNIDNEE